MCLHRDRAQILCLSFFPLYFLYFHIPNFHLSFVSCFHPLYLHLSFLSAIFPFFPKSFPSILLFFRPSLLCPFSLFSFLPPVLSFSPLSFASSIPCVLVWKQLCALHTFCFMWLQLCVLLLFGHRRDNRICVKCSFALGSTLIGVSTQAGFQMPAQT